MLSEKIYLIVEAKNAPVQLFYQNGFIYYFVVSYSTYLKLLDVYNMSERRGLELAMRQSFQQKETILDIENGFIKFQKNGVEFGGDIELGQAGIHSAYIETY